MGTVAQISAIAAIRAKARAAVAWDLLPESKIRTDPQHLDSSAFLSGWFSGWSDKFSMGTWDIYLIWRYDDESELDFL
jgi:hypothetical protein